MALELFLGWTTWRAPFSTPTNRPHFPLENPPITLRLTSGSLSVTPSRRCRLCEHNMHAWIKRLILNNVYKYMNLGLWDGTRIPLKTEIAEKSAICVTRRNKIGAVCCARSCFAGFRGADFLLKFILDRKCDAWHDKIKGLWKNMRKFCQK